MNTETLLFLVVGIISGIIIGWLLAKQRTGAATGLLQAQNEQQKLARQQLEAQLQVLQAEKEKQLGEAQQYRGQNTQLLTELEQYRMQQEQLNKIQQERVALQEQLRQAKEQLENQRTELEANNQRLERDFRLLAQNILDEKSRKFTELNEEKMKGVLQPVREELEQFKKKVEETYDRESKERFTLGREVQRLIETTQQVSQEANNLTTALKGNKKQQGNWGELLLESILEHSGLTKNREYFLQEFLRDASGQVIRDENGNALQPDVIIRYPDERKVIIDSKVSLIAWDRCVAADAVEEQKAAMAEHIRSLRQHVAGLSRKNYGRYAQALDYVIMFVPIEAAFLEAMKEDTELWKDAYKQNILLTSPTNLLAVLKIVADLWRIEKQSRNAIDIAEKAGALYDKFNGFVRNLEQVGRKLTEAQQSYDDAFKQLSTGKGNLVRRAEELRKMGATTKNRLPDSLVQEADEDEDS